MSVARQALMDRADRLKPGEVRMMFVSATSSARKLVPVSSLLALLLTRENERRYEHGNKRGCVLTVLPAAHINRRVYIGTPDLQMKVGQHNGRQTEVEFLLCKGDRVTDGGIRPAGLQRDLLETRRERRWFCLIPDRKSVLAPGLLISDSRLMRWAWAMLDNRKAVKVGRPEFPSFYAEAGEYESLRPRHDEDLYRLVMECAITGQWCIRDTGMFAESPSGCTTYAENKGGEIFLTQQHPNGEESYFKHSSVVEVSECITAKLARTFGRPLPYRLLPIVEEGKRVEVEDYECLYRPIPVWDGPDDIEALKGKYGKQFEILCRLAALTTVDNGQPVLDNNVAYGRNMYATLPDIQRFSVRETAQGDFGALRASSSGYEIDLYEHALRSKLRTMSRSPKRVVRDDPKSSGARRMAGALSKALKKVERPRERSTVKETPPALPQAAEESRLGPGPDDATEGYRIFLERRKRFKLLRRRGIVPNAVIDRAVRRYAAPQLVKYTKRQERVLAIQEEHTS